LRILGGQPVDVFYLHEGDDDLDDFRGDEAVGVIEEQRVLLA
jgi:hypothetical protein